MGQGHSHVQPQGGNEKALKIALALTSTFLIAEAVAGVLTQSLALISDAAHMLTDSAALAIALFAIRIGKRPADTKRTFGYARYEILAALFNALMLFAVAVYILVEAYKRFKSPPEIQSGAMLVVAILGLIINLVSMRILMSGKDKSLNVKGAYLEVWSDMLGSIGVIAGALIIRFTGWGWVDTVIAVAIGLWVLPRTWTLLQESINVLLEATPAHVDIDDIQESILGIEGAQSIHDLHVWSISNDKVSLTAHVVYDSRTSNIEVLDKIRKLLAEKFDIHHVTIQMEDTPCEQAADEHNFSPLGKEDHDDHKH
ncbi:cation transporter [Herbaspirillum huttiense]|uniref:cation diffusion facilitator family transporter n=1 Tax=Herbaspirillum TaxID=963 RepID=UPI001066D8A6|nr:MULTISPECIES: cation diffusion facilitator family transporter [Herbaspirillum]MCI1016749.1 cation transporter [Herbaspirillum sp. C7C2]QBP73597.1 cation transporter [Herbaspirillum huttiense]